MHYKRSDRIAAVIQEEISTMLVSGLKDPAIGFITITRVNVTNDLRHAKIFYSVYGDEEKKEQSKKAIARASGYIRSEIGHKLGLRFVPEINFYYDDSTEYADHIESLLKKIEQEKL